MATCGDPLDDLSGDMTCSICLETFKLPKYLPCLHTFCEGCIHTYIVSSTKNDRTQGFKCPICRRTVKMDAENSKPKLWAKQLPENQFVLSLTARKIQRKALMLCSVCVKYNKRRNAVCWCTECKEAYCESCENSHLAFKDTAKHGVVSIGDMNEGKNKTETFGFIACSEHQEKALEIYCKDHSKLCCIVCAKDHRKNCDHVLFVEQAASGIKNSDKSKDLAMKLRRKSTELKKLLKCHGNAINDIESQAENVCVEIVKQTGNLNKKFDKLEQEVRSELETTRKHVAANSLKETCELSSLKTRIDYWKRIFEACLLYGSEVQCLIKLQEIQEEMSQLNNELSSVRCGMTETAVSFDPVIDMENIYLLGQINAFPQDCKEVVALQGRIVVLCAIDLPGKRGVERAISGIFFSPDLSKSDIFLTDKQNYRVVQYEYSRHCAYEVIFKGELKIESGPTDITEVDFQTLAVATGSCKVYLINVNPLSPKRVLTLAVEAWGLRYIANEYVATYNGTISWLDATTGAKLRDQASKGNKARFVSSSKKGEYLFMNDRNSIQFVSEEKRSFTYTNDQLLWSYGQAMDSRGNIYATSYNRNTIHQLTPDGHLIRITSLSNIYPESQFPWNIRFKRNVHEMDDTFLLTFHLSGTVLICTTGGTF